MRKFKRIIAAVLALTMLMAMSVVTVSAEDEALIIQPDILNSITVEEKTGSGLAFLINVNVKGAQTTAQNEFDNTNATVTVGGVEHKVIAMGAVMANTAEFVATMDTLTRESVNAEGTIIDIPAKYLWAYDADTCSFAVRIINLPDMYKGYAIGCRPYVVLENGTVIYGDADISTYNQVYYTNAPEETPVLDMSALAGTDVHNVTNKGHLQVTAAAAEYAPIAPDYKEGYKVSLTLSNVKYNAKTSVGNWVEYTCYDADGNALVVEKVVIDEMLAETSKEVEFYAPIGTVSIEQTNKEIVDQPDLVLPAVGSDADVKNKRGRILVHSCTAEYTGSNIKITLTLKNNTTRWITEETDYVCYTSYDQNGDYLKSRNIKIYIGVIDTKKNPSKTFTFYVPFATDEVQLTNSKIVYWTEWS